MWFTKPMYALERCGLCQYNERRLFIGTKMLYLLQC